MESLPISLTCYLFQSKEKSAAKSPVQKKDTPTPSKRGRGRPPKNQSSAKVDDETKEQEAQSKSTEEIINKEDQNDINNEQKETGNEKVGKLNNIDKVPEPKVETNGPAVADAKSQNDIPKDDPEPIKSSEKVQETSVGGNDTSTAVPNEGN